MTWPAHQRQPLQTDTLLMQTFQIPRLNREPPFELFQGKVEVFGLAQGLAGLDPGLGSKGGDRRLIRKHQDITDVPRFSRRGLDQGRRDLAKG